VEWASRSSHGKHIGGPTGLSIRKNPYLAYRTAPYLLFLCVAEKGRRSTGSTYNDKYLYESHADCS
jgi:hypothetical protein